MSELFGPIYSALGTGANIKVIGVGGGGGNALNHMVNSFDPASLGSDSMGSIEFFSVNTDAQALRASSVKNTIQIGAEITQGLGVGGNPAKAHQAAEEDREALSNMIAGANMVFIAAGMGGGTGTGAAPVIAEIAKSQGALTVGIVTKPFLFEQNKRSRIANAGIQELSKHVDSLIIIENEKLLTTLPKNVRYDEAFSEANNVLRNAVLGISSMIISHGMVNVDFNDVREVMLGMGRALMGTGIAEGENRAEEAAKMAIASPLLEDMDLSGAKGILVNIVSGRDIGLHEISAVMQCVTASIDKENATVIYGSAFDDNMEGKIRVTLVATGIGSDGQGGVKENVGGYSVQPPQVQVTQMQSPQVQVTQMQPPPYNGSNSQPPASPVGYHNQPNNMGTPHTMNTNTVGYQPTNPEPLYAPNTVGNTATQVSRAPENPEPATVGSKDLWTPIPQFMQNRNNNG